MTSITDKVSVSPEWAEVFADLDKEYAIEQKFWDDFDKQEQKNIITEIRKELPTVLQSIIFEYDNTYHEIYQEKIVNYIKALFSPLALITPQRKYYDQVLGQIPFQCHHYFNKVYSNIPYDDHQQAGLLSADYLGESVRLKFSIKQILIMFKPYKGPLNKSQMECLRYHVSYYEHNI
tara:strand:- start:953 stop:1483 length:531 start_codon:yes stop_codon:yes gene_type:complete